MSGKPPTRPPRMSLIIGDGSADVVEVLEEALEKARAGEIDALAIVSLANGDYLARFAWKDELPHPWALLLAGLEHGKYTLLDEGL